MLKPFPQVRVSHRAEELLRSLVQRQGANVLVLSGTAAAPSIVHVRTPVGFQPGPCDVRIGEVASCLVYADAESICWCPHELLVLSPAQVDGGRLVSLVTRPESEAERQQRLFHGHVPPVDTVAALPVAT